MALFSTTEPAVSPAAGELPQRVQQALAKVTEIGSLPEVTARIVQVVDDPNSTAREIQQVVEGDPALAAKLLKIVNSAFYGLPAQVGNLERAILMLGLSAVRNLALAASVSRLIKPGNISAEFTTRDLWRHSVAVAVGAKLIAGSTRYPLADEAFVAGLVHDMGLIVAQQLFATEVRTVAEQCSATPQNFCGLEQLTLGADHQAFGVALATKWKFPLALRNAVGYHHTPGDLQSEHQRLAAIIYMADMLCCRAKLGFWLTARAQTPAPEMLQLVGLTPAALGEIAGQLPARVAEAEHIFAGD